MSSQSPLYNADAGLHPLPVDKREIAAVLRAARRCCRDYPYLTERFGQRGKLFIRSDDGYLATLADHPQSYVHDQVEWLSRTLTSRGMPRWLLETHLETLCAELAAAVPDRAVDYDKLRQAAKALREARQFWIAQSDFDALSANFAASSGGTFKGAGELLIAAVCDECCGLAEAVPSLTCWLAAPERFSPQWCAAVADTLTRARALAAHAKGSSP